MSRELVRREIERLRHRQRGYEMRAKEAEQFGDDLSAANFRSNAAEMGEKIQLLRDEGIETLYRKRKRHHFQEEDY